MNNWENVMLQTFPDHRVLTEKEVLNSGLFGDAFVSAQLHQILNFIFD